MSVTENENWKRETEVKSGRPFRSVPGVEEKRQPTTHFVGAGGHVNMFVRQMERERHKYKEIVMCM